MKNYRFIVLGVALLLCFVLIGNNVRADSSCLPQIKLVNQDPNPAVPGSYVKLLFEVSGLTNVNCHGMAVQLKTEYPFSLDPNDKPIQSIAGNLNTQDYKTTWNIPYKVRVADDALEGDYDLKLLYHMGESENFETNSVQQEFNLTVVDAQTDFATVVQESSAGQVSIGVVNTGKNTANSVIVSLPPQETFRVSGTSQQIVGNLAAGDYTLVSFSVASRTSRNVTRTDSGMMGTTMMGESKPLKIQIDYTDGIGKRRSVLKEVDFSLTMNGNATRVFTQNASTSTSGSSRWVYLIGVIVLLIVGYFVYQRYTEHHSRQHSSGNAPDWVAEERKSRKR